ncbi:hypothetical protein [Sphingomonas xinjiangensis]|uniref:Uncharacterized protein n=1 Tax=Sphingomonas xinjiangensis TaxID=643568 RepID=A0A840YEJ1_9SPHN|nr:hypothetical protein [Sphingomonas xinjiangensis]MBB5711867.1 hypothetical protein [Sphingomonas xinjiangensis]
MRIRFPNRVEAPNAPFGFAHLLNTFHGLGVTSLSDLWINAHVWVGDQRLQVKDDKLLTQLDIWEPTPGSWVATPLGEFHLRPAAKPYNPFADLFDHDD